VTAPGEGEWHVASTRLSAALAAHGGPESRATDTLGQFSYSARVQARRASEELPVWYRGSLQGFAERLGEPVAGTLRLTAEHLALSSAEEGVDRWPLLAIGAIQTSSSSLQISPSEGGVVQFRFEEDSPKRWDDLLRLAVRRAYRREGRGEIIEFQPRIRSR
jgi:hypothetical protein